MGGFGRGLFSYTDELGLSQRCVAEFSGSWSRGFRHGWASARPSCGRRRDGCGGFYSSATTIGLLPGGFAAARRPLGQQGGDDHEVVGEHRGANEHRKALGAFGAATLHAATAHQHRDATLDAGAKALALLELRRPFVGLALRRFGAATLRNAYRLDGAVHAGGHVLLAEEAAIGAIKVRRTAEGAAMEPERRRHVNFVGRVSLQYLILGNQASGAFG